MKKKTLWKEYQFKFNIRGNFYAQKKSFSFFYENFNGKSLKFKIAEQKFVLEFHFLTMVFILISTDYRGRLFGRIYTTLGYTEQPAPEIQLNKFEIHDIKINIILSQLCFILHLLATK